MRKAFPLPVIEFLLPEEVPTVSEESSHCQKKREATAVKIALLLKSRRNCIASDGTSKKKGRTVTLTAEDMQKRKNDVKARTTLLMSLPDEHQLRFSKYKTTKELWAAILKTFGSNEATKKTKKNLLKQQYSNFKAEGSETSEKTFNRLQNHLKVYESEVQKKSEPNSQNMAFISSAKHNRGNEKVNIASVSTASTNDPTASANIVVASISQDTAYIKWNMALLSMKADRFWNKIGKKISIQGTDVVRFDKSKVECFNCHKMGHFSYMANDEENHALIADEETPTEFDLMAKTSAESEVFDNSLCSKACFQTASKDLDSLLESQRLDKNKEGLGYSSVPPPPAQIYSPSKKDMTWTGFQECADDTITNYSRPAPTIESFPDDTQNRNPSVTETEASPITISPKSFIKFVKANDSTTKSKTDKVETAKKPPVKYAEQYRKPTKKPNVRGNKRNWNNLKSHQLGECKIIGKRTIKTGKLEFENVYIVKDLKYNMFSMSQIRDNKNSILFTDSECIMLGQNFKMSDDDNVLLRTPRQHNMYSIDLNNIVPHKDLTCLIAKASTDEGMLWHRRLGHLNFKTMNRLVRHNLVRGLPSKCFENDHTCTACLKGKQHKAS
nr:putative ribonuclease H-like domain-containing protein [Tanacetum cinerariifolium]